MQKNIYNMQSAPIKIIENQLLTDFPPKKLNLSKDLSGGKKPIVQNYKLFAKPVPRYGD